VRLIFLSGLSGSGKSVALHMLEDLGYYCIDNMPAALLRPFISHTVRGNNPAYARTAVGLDARNTDTEIATVPALIDEFKRSGIDCEVIFLVANQDELLRRFAETRRAHPLRQGGADLRGAIAEERRLLEPLLSAADLVIDSTNIGVHELRELIKQRVAGGAPERLSILFESFGYKHGIPADADFVFDVRALPNPYWDKSLRALSGRDEAVIRYLDAEPAVQLYIADLIRFMDGRIPEYRAGNRRYLTVAVGCTGGQHRSVYIVEKLAAHYGSGHPEVRLRHSALGETGSFASSAAQRA
jgi:UPF0042 nucleotide-binding protein